VDSDWEKQRENWPSFETANWGQSVIDPAVEQEYASNRLFASIDIVSF